VGIIDATLLRGGLHMRVGIEDFESVAHAISLSAVQRLWPIGLVPPGDAA
jgi:hypothetical protein